MRGLPRAVKSSLEKACDSALLAVEVYNKPAVKFKSGGYITLMVIAWTSLLHAIFFRSKQKPYYKKPNGRYEKREGEYRHWELGESIRQYFGSDTSNAIRKNLEFFIPLRNKIEHRSMPELDASIFGECQAMLLNFDEILEKEFGAKHRLRESLSFSLQLFPSTENLVAAVKKNPATKPVVDFIQAYRSSISPDIQSSGKYSFKAFLIQVANHPSADAVPIRFVHYDKLSTDERKQIDQLAAIVKVKPTPVFNLDLMKPGEVVKKVQQGLGNPKVRRSGKMVDKFTSDTHTRAWKKYKVRPPSKSTTPWETDPKYCVYDKLNGNYGYTTGWVEFLVDKLGYDVEFDSLYD